MKVLYFHQHFTTPMGRSGTRSYEMAKELVSRGHEVTIVCGSSGVGETGLDTAFYRGRREGVVEGIGVIEFELPYSNADGFLKRAWTFLKFSFRSIKVVFSKRVDIVFATSTPLTAAIPGIVASWFTSAKFIFEVRDLWPELPRAMGVIKNPIILFMMGVLERRGYKAARHCIALAPGIRKGINRHVSEEKITLIPNGCDVEFFSNNNDWRPDSIPPSHFLAIFAGAHGQANGLDAVLDGAKELLKRGRLDIKILLIGDGRLKPALLQRQKDENIDNVVFHDPVRKERIADLLSSADVGLQILANIPAFYYGTSPNKFFDYIAAGLPVLTNYPGWVADLITENNCGLATTPDDPGSFAESLICLADDADQRREMGRAARVLAEREFDRKLLASEFSTIFESLAGE